MWFKIREVKMAKLSKIMGVASAAALAAGLSVSAAGAVTVISDGDVVAIPSTDTAFIGNVDAAGGAGSWAVDFEADWALSSNAEVSILELVAGTFSGLMMSWVNTDTGVEISSVDVEPIVTGLGTIFVDPDSLNQTLLVSWGDSLAGAGFDVEVTVSAVPLPAAGLLLLGGMGGLGFVGRRRKAKA
jgi:hypothetical protein